MKINRLLAMIITVPGTLFLYPATSSAQDNAFMDCADYSDRDERVACLEAALEEATENSTVVEPSPAETQAPAAIADPSPAAPVARRPEQVTTPAPQAQEEESRIADFGQSNARIESSDDNEILYDTVTALEKRRNLWRVTLSSGQIWQQEYPKRYNLREGDEVAIERGGFGNGFRLSAERLSGFIRVERVDNY